MIKLSMKKTRRDAAMVVVALVLVLASGCGAKPSADSVPSTATQTGVSRRGSAPSKILVVIEENHSLAQMRTGMPYLAGLSATYGYATHWSALAHPSEPNYLAIAGGSTFGVTDDASPAANAGKVGAALSVFDQALEAGKTATTYAESIPEPCHVYDYPDRKVGTPVYAVRHNPWVYFQDSRTSCLAHDVGLSGFAAAAKNNELPNVGFLIPNLLHDAHDASLAAADSWLKEQFTSVLASKDFASGRLVVVVTADEDDKHSGNVVLTSVLSSQLHHKVVDTPLTHYSLSRFISEVLGQPPLGRGKGAPDMGAAFGL